MISWWQAEKRYSVSWFQEIWRKPKQALLHTVDDVRSGGGDGGKL